LRMVELRVLVPEEHVGAVYRFLGELLAATEPTVDPMPGAVDPMPGAVAWTKELALEAVGSIVGEAETRLLRRVAEARGQRVPMSELASTLGLPGDASVERDFAELSGWCAAAGRPTMPVVTGGDGEGGWYWMSLGDYDLFLRAFAENDAADEDGGA